MRPIAESIRPVLLAACLLLLAVADVHAQTNYAMDWFTIDGSGGTSTGGVYAVSGAIGQPDAGAMSSGNFTLRGGFWSVVAAVATSDAPLLSVLRTSTNTIVVSWPASSMAWTLQQSSISVSSGNWSNVTSGIEIEGTNTVLVVNPPIGNRFYRLWKSQR